MTLRAPVRATAAHRAAAPVTAHRAAVRRAAAAPATKEGMMRGHEEWREWMEWRDTRLRRECAATKGALLWEWPWKILLFVNLSAHFDREPDTRILPFSLLWDPPSLMMHPVFECALSVCSLAVCFVFCRVALFSFLFALMIYNNLKVHRLEEKSRTTSTV